MYQLNHILVCLDLSEMDDSLIRYADFLINKIKPESITFLHVMKSYDIPKELMDAFPELDEPVPEIIREELQEKINEQCSSCADVKIKVVVKDSYPMETIVKYTQENHITLTLMGKKMGYEGNGSIARKVIGIIPSSVLLVSESVYERIDNLLVRMDFSKASEMALQMAFRIKELTGANVACHHTHKLPVGYFPQIDPDQDEKLQKYVEKVSIKEFNKFNKHYKHNTDEVSFSYTVDAENEEDQILYRKALNTGADMIIIGSSMKSGLADILIDSTSEKLAESDKNIPVLIVNDRSKAIVFLKRLFQ
ncbi:universal stress protein [Draconibacterium halophilum]|uniref:Universal stress protein n=1 Tax=Draconibacterium halophilum TaxID=2706887 RepID=A0A6C0R8L9_9BACT|nr:universal stress protein [Draconibacterium halophilum]QIA06407.1 universal stress protein [Draconibacterium halophilum]